uniref:Uncharacterized protein n=1 Tax=Cacopsylla melanoneura TaxID=428564 RepID=A0A8D8PWN8_9HEMI
MFHALILASKILPKPDLSGNTDKILLHGLVPDEIERENHLTTGDEIARVKDEIVEVINAYVINALNEDCNRGNALGSVGKDTIEVRARESVHEDCEEKYVLSHEDNGFTEEIVFKNISFREETTPTSNDVIIVEETLNSNNNRRNNTNHLVNTVEGSPNLVIIVNSNKDKVNHPLDHTLEDDTHDVDTTVNKDNAVELNLNLKRNTDNNFEHIDIVGENRRTCVKECESDTDQTNNIPELSDDTPHLPETVSDVFFVQTGEIINPVVEHTSGNMLDNLAMKLYGEKIRHRVRLSVESEPSSATKNLNHDFGVDINGNSNRKACSLEKTESDYMDNFMYQSFRIEVTEDKEKFGKDNVSEIEAFSKNKENEIEAFIEDILIEAFENAKQTGALDSPNVTDNFTHYHFLDIREDIEYDSEKKVVNNDDESNENDAEIKRYPTNLTDISNCHSVLGTRNGTDGDSEKESCQNEFGANTEPNIVGTDGVNHERKRGEHHNKNNKTEQEELTDGKVTYKMIHIEDITDEIDESSVARNDIKGKEYKIKSNEDIPNRTNTNDTKTADLTNTVGPKEASLDTPNRENKHLTKTILAQETNAGLPHRVNTNNIAKTNDVNAKTTPSRVNKSGITKTVDANMKDMFDRNRLIRESKQSSGALDEALRITRNNLSWIECTGEDADKQSNVQRVNRVTETGDDSRYVRINHDDRSDNENQINTRSSCSAGSRNFGLYGHSENELKRDSARNQIYRETEINGSGNVIKRDSASNKIYLETEINGYERTNTSCSGQTVIDAIGDANTGTLSRSYHEETSRSYKESDKIEPRIPIYQETRNPSDGSVNSETQSRIHQESRRNSSKTGSYGSCQDARSNSNEYVKPKYQSLRESRRNSHKTGAYGSCQDIQSNRNNNKTDTRRSNSKENVKPKYTSLREAWFHDDVEGFIRDSISNNTNSSCSWDGNSDHGSTAGKSDDSNVFGYPAYKFKVSLVN